MLVFLNASAGTDHNLCDVFCDEVAQISYEVHSMSLSLVIVGPSCMCPWWPACCHAEVHPRHAQAHNTPRLMHENDELWSCTLFYTIQMLPAFAFGHAWCGLLRRAVVSAAATYFPPSQYVPSFPGITQSQLNRSTLPSGLVLGFALNPNGRSFLKFFLSSARRCSARLGMANVGECTWEENSCCCC